MADTLKTIRKQAFEDLEDARSRFQGWADGIVDEARKAVREHTEAQNELIPCKKHHWQPPATGMECPECEKDHSPVVREWHSILYELLSYAYDHDRASSFDYDFWDECVQLVFSHKREPWGRDGVRAQELLERIKAYVKGAPSEELLERIKAYVKGAPSEEVVLAERCEECGLKTPCPKYNGRFICPSCVTETFESLNTPNMTRCKACGEEIYIGKTCGEACTKLWMADLEQAHRDKSKGKRFCKQCGAAHEMKSNYCGECNHARHLNAHREKHNV